MTCKWVNNHDDRRSPKCGGFPFQNGLYKWLKQMEDDPPPGYGAVVLCWRPSWKRWGGVPGRISGFSLGIGRGGSWVNDIVWEMIDESQNWGLPKSFVSYQV